MLNTKPTSAGEIQAALAAGDFEPVFQPIARLGDGALAGFEALARWRRAANLIVGPSDFLEAALEHDLLGEISRRIMRESCRTMSGWRGEGATGLFLSVNVAGRDLERADFVFDAIDAIEQAGLSQQAVKIEITEQQILRDPTHAARELARLRERGVRILFDDFGSGYSSLTWLARLPCDAIKFDGTLVANVAEDGPERKILRALTGLARDLGLETIAEGVETEAQRDAVAAFGCDYAQGHFYAKALSSNDARALIWRLPAEAAA
jgi:c-di-GMP-specific phosphodiesterase